MSKIDIILALPLLWGAFIGFKKGLILELASLVGLILGIYGALKFSDYTAQQLSDNFEISPEWMGLLSFLLTFIIIVVLIFLLAKILDKALKMVALGLVNRILGLIFGVIKYALIVSVLMYFFHNLNQRFAFVSESIMQESLLWKPLQLTTQPFSSLLENFEVSDLQEKIDEVSTNPE